MNTTKRIIEGTATAWLSEYIQISPQDFAEADAQKLIDAMHITTYDASDSGYSRIGTVRVEVTLLSEVEATQSKIEALRAQKQKTIADAQLKATELENKIQQLLAIAFEG